MKRFALTALLCLVLMPAFGQSDDTPLNVYNGPIPEGTRTFYLAPDGDDANPGTIEAPWARMHYAVLQLQPGDVLVVRGGVYDVPAPVSLGTDGTEEAPIVITAYPGEVPIFDFSSMTRARNNHGFRLNGDWWHLIGFTIRYAAHNGIRMDGSHNVLEQLTAYENVDTGIHMAGGASHNLVLNCDSFRNFDPPEGGNADGFSAKFEVGPGNVYRGCRAWNNSDDGWDLWEAHNVVVIDSSWAFGNGDGEALGAGPEFDGNGNGFKLGGGPNAATRPNVGHVVTRSMAFDNIGPGGNSKGFDNNNNFGGFRLENNSAFNNGRNFVFPYIVPGQQAVFVNNLAFDPAGSTNVQLPPESALFVANSWQMEEEVTSEMFESLDTDAAKAPRKADGSLPDIPLLRPVPLSLPVDAGVAVGEAFFGEAPDLGAVEIATGAMVQGYVDRGSAGVVQDLRVYDLDFAADWDADAAPSVGMDPYGDGRYSISELPGSAELEGSVRTAPGSASLAYLDVLADFRAEAGTHVLVAHADAITPKPEWLSVFEQMEEDVVLTDDTGTEHTLSIFRHEADGGEVVSLGRNSWDGTTEAPMYLVLVGRLTGVSTDPEELPLAETGFVSVYPNPVRGLANISFALEHSGNVSMRIYDALGRQVAALATGNHAAGAHTATWDATGIASGVYFLHLQTEYGSSTSRVVLMR